MVRVYLPFFLALFILVVPKESVGQLGHLAEVNDINITVEDIGSDEQKLGFKKQEIQSHVFVLLRSKLPRLAVRDVSYSTIYVNINIGLTNTGSYYGSVRVEILRPATIKKTGKLTTGTFWIRDTRLSGPPGGCG